MPIIQPLDITQRATWNATSQHPQDAQRTVQNLDSSMDWAEHQKIVAKALALLAGSAVPEEFAYLKSAYNVTKLDGRKTTVFVSKGIHQPETNPHMQLETESKDSKGNGAAYVKRYHLNLSAVATPGMDGRFQWTGVQFSTTDDQNATHEYPVGVVPVMKERATTLNRRNSVSTADLSAHIKEMEAIAAIAAEAKKVKEFDELCSAFEQTNGIRPIDRAIRDQAKAWGVQPTHSGFAKVGGGTIKFQYQPRANTFTVVKS